MTLNNNNISQSFERQTDKNVNSLSSVTTVNPDGELATYKRLTNRELFGGTKLDAPLLFQEKLTLFTPGQIPDDIQKHMSAASLDLNLKNRSIIMTLLELDTKTKLSKNNAFTPFPITIDKSTNCYAFSPVMGIAGRDNLGVHVAIGEQTFDNSGAVDSLAKIIFDNNKSSDGNKITLDRARVLAGCFTVLHENAHAE